MSKSKAYYAHSMRKYNSSEEAEEIAFIQKHFKGEVICPNVNLGELGNIERYLEVIKSVDCVYATEFRGYIGRGVFDECSFALKNKITVLAVRRDITRGSSSCRRCLMSLKPTVSILCCFGCLITK